MEDKVRAETKVTKSKETRRGSKKKQIEQHWVTDRVLTMTPLPFPFKLVLYIDFAICRVVKKEEERGRSIEEKQKEEEEVVNRQAACPPVVKHLVGDG
jgi:hypothetical protein